MIKIQALLMGKGEGDIEKTLQEALAEVWQEFEADGYNKPGKGTGVLWGGDGQAGGGD